MKRMKTRMIIMMRMMNHTGKVLTGVKVTVLGNLFVVLVTQSSAWADTLNIVITNGVCPSEKFLKLMA